MRVTDKYTFFYGSDEPFSNWYEGAPFVDRGTGQYFATNEHYMMWRKAMLFRDVETAYLIMKADHPRKAKALGRQVHGFDEEIWKLAAEDIVYMGASWKFHQHPGLMKQLLATHPTLLVEASPTDCIWGVGLRESDDRILDHRNWRGANLLGSVLTRLRDNVFRNITESASDQYLRSGVTI